MKRRKVWRYTCEFCGKSNCSSGHMARHEKGCTMNPQRVCGLCGLRGDVCQAPIGELLEIVRDLTVISESSTRFSDGGYLRKVDITKTVDALREATEDCPACTLAALRQSELNIDPSKDEVVGLFDFKKESATWWSDLRAAEAEERPQYY